MLLRVASTSIAALMISGAALVAAPAASAAPLRPTVPVAITVPCAEEEPEACVGSPEWKYEHQIVSITKRKVGRVNITTYRAVNGKSWTVRTRR